MRTRYLGCRYAPVNLLFAQVQRGQIVRPFAIIFPLLSAVAFASVCVVPVHGAGARDPINCKTVIRLGEPANLPRKLRGTVREYCVAKDNWEKARARVTADANGKARSPDENLRKLFEKYQEAYQKYLQAVQSPN